MGLGEKLEWVQRKLLNDYKIVIRVQHETRNYNYNPRRNDGNESVRNLAVNLYTEFSSRAGWFVNSFTTTTHPYNPDRIKERKSKTVEEQAHQYYIETGKWPKESQIEFRVRTRKESLFDSVDTIKENVSSSNLPNLFSIQFSDDSGFSYTVKSEYAKKRLEKAPEEYVCSNCSKENDEYTIKNKFGRVYIEKQVCPYCESGWIVKDDEQLYYMGGMNEDYVFYCDGKCDYQYKYPILSDWEEYGHHIRAVSEHESVELNQMASFPPNFEEINYKCKICGSNICRKSPEDVAKEIET